jgi:hypothetical protein
MGFTVFQHQIMCDPSYTINPIKIEYGTIVFTTYTSVILSYGSSQFN